METIEVAILLIVVFAVVATATFLFTNFISVLHPLQPISASLVTNYISYKLGNTYIVPVRFTTQSGGAYAVLCSISVVYNYNEESQLTFPAGTNVNETFSSSGINGYVFVPNTVITKSFTENINVGFSQNVTLQSIILGFCPAGYTKPKWTESINIPGISIGS